MTTIKRSCSYRIITPALNVDGKPLVALLAPGANDCKPILDADRLQAAIDDEADTILVYNQHAEAGALVNALTLTENRVFIEIRQDTRGVPGLNALHQGKSGNETLELIYQ